MKRTLPLLAIVLLLCSPAGLCWGKRADRDGKPNAEHSATAAAPGDINSALDQVLKPEQTLDEVLSSPLPKKDEPARGAGVSARANTPAADELDKTLAPAPIIAPVLRSGKQLQGKAEVGAEYDGQAGSRELRGTAADDGGVKMLEPNSRQVLKGTASMSSTRLGGAIDDPDVADRELMVEWDRWRNRFLRAVQLQVQATVNNPEPEDYVPPRFDPVTGYLMPRFPLGTEAWFDCAITSDRRIARARITQSSGIPEYDRAILNGIRALEGTSLLQFPRGSRRSEVSQEAGIRTSTSSDFRYHNFGDVERYRSSY